MGVLRVSTTFGVAIFYTALVLWMSLHTMPETQHDSCIDVPSAVAPSTFSQPDATELEQPKTAASELQQPKPGSPSATVPPLECKPQNHSGVVYTSFDIVQPLNETIPALDPTTSVCHYRSNKSEFGNYHFPHSLQQLLLCHSFWESQNATRRVLYVKGGKKFALRSKYNTGMLKAIKGHWNVQVERELPPEVVNASAIPQMTDLRLPYVVGNPNDLKSLRSGILQYYKITHQMRDEPVIGLVNREGSRKLLNVEALRHLIGDQFTVKEATFEKMSFLDQIQFMSEIDIFVTPHGAQMTSLFAMPDCGRILEIYPLNYLWPDFFGSLASGIGLNFSYIYTGLDPVFARENKKRRVQMARARMHDVCPRVEVVHEAILEHAEAWRRCTAR